MKIMTGNMWDVQEEADLFLFTSNGVVQRGLLNMGAGMAGQMVKKVSSTLKKGIGSAILREGHKVEDDVYSYGLLVSANWPSVKWGAFQTKLHYREKSHIPTIELAVCKLDKWAREHPKAQIHCNFPAVGLGRLTYRQVLPIIKNLPDNVHFWTFDKWYERKHYEGYPQSIIESIESITGGVDPDEYLDCASEHEYSPKYEMWLDQMGIFWYTYRHDGSMAVVVDADSYPGEMREGLTIYRVENDMLYFTWLENDLIHISRKDNDGINHVDMSREDAENMFPVIARTNYALRS